MASYRVLVVTNLWPYDADPSYGSFVQAQMESLRPLGVEFDVLFINGRESRWNYVRAIRRLRECLRANRYDLIHAHMGLSGLVARCQRRVPVVVSFMGHDVLGKPKRNGRISLAGRFFQVSSFVLARCVSAVIVKSPGMKARLRLRSADVIPNGVNLELFRPLDRQQARRSLGLDPQKKYVLFPYDPEREEKRYDLVEAAVARARAKVPELRMLQVSSVPLSRMPVYMNAADVLVLASYCEGSPNVVKEAMATNLPVVTVEVGDTADLIAATEGNYLVPREVEAIAARIAEVCVRGNRARGRDEVARFSTQSIAQRIVTVYASVTRAQKGKPA